MISSLKIAKGIAIFGKKILDETDKDVNSIMDYLEKLKEHEQPIGAYLICVKLLSGFDDETRNKLLETFKDVKWEKMK